MAAHVIVTVGDGNIIKIPEQCGGDPRFQKGARLELVPVVGVGEPTKPQGDWRRLRGALVDSGANLNEELNRERLLENEHDSSVMRGVRA